jgi:DNA (cytosine-5)-methyltransferase 1
MKLRILDLFCCAGGCAVGYHRAGFEVVGVDIKPQPRYPFEFYQADALIFSTEGFDAIHASPPCQGYCAMKTMKNRRERPLLVEAVRAKLRASGLPYIIENVFGAPLENAVMLCGSHFGLIASDGYQIRRHRYFESNIPLVNTAQCKHGLKTVGVYGAKARDIALEKRHYAQDKNTRGKPVGVVLSKQTAFESMGIDWMNMRELSEAIPPAYTEFLGKQLRAHIVCAKSAPPENTSEARLTAYNSASAT